MDDHAHQCLVDVALNGHEVHRLTPPGRVFASGVVSADSGRVEVEQSSVGTAIHWIPAGWPGIDASIAVDCHSDAVEVVGVFAGYNNNGGGDPGSTRLGPGVDTAAKY
jgi:hypothetical protein